MEPFETDVFERRIQVLGMNSASFGDDGFLTAYSNLVRKKI